MADGTLQSFKPFFRYIGEPQFGWLWFFTRIDENRTHARTATREMVTRVTKVIRHPLC